MKASFVWRPQNITEVYSVIKNLPKNFLSRWFVVFYCDINRKMVPTFDSGRNLNVSFHIKCTNDLIFC